MLTSARTRRSLLTLLVSASIPLFSGCNDGGGGGDSGGVSSAVGVWKVLKEGGRTNYWQFGADGSITVWRNPELTEKYFTGTFRQDGSNVTGDFALAGAGTGQIEGTVSADGQTFPFTFIEHWHTPYKRIPVKGFREK